MKVTHDVSDHNKQVWVYIEPWPNRPNSSVTKPWTAVEMTLTMDSPHTFFVIRYGHQWVEKNDAEDWAMAILKAVGLAEEWETTGAIKELGLYGIFPFPNV